MDVNSLMDLKIDYAFKQLFGNQEQKQIMITFLNAILKRNGEHAITDLQILNNELDGVHPDEKKSRLDILAETNLDEKVNIEIQFNNKYDMIQRSLYYWGKINQQQLKTGQSYREIKPTIMINILNFDIFKQQTNEFHTTFRLLENDKHFLLTDLLEFHFLEMPKLLHHWKQKKLHPRYSPLDRWLLLLGTVNQKDKIVYHDIFKELEEIAMSDEVLHDAIEKWEKMSQDELQRINYALRNKEIMDEYAFIREQELRVQEGINDGIKEGMKKGLEEGRNEAKKSMAIKMLQKGMVIDDIIDITNLSRDEIIKLQQELGR